MMPEGSSDSWTCDTVIAGSENRKMFFASYTDFPKWLVGLVTSRVAEQMLTRSILGEGGCIFTPGLKKVAGASAGCGSRSLRLLPTSW